MLVYGYTLRCMVVTLSAQKRETKTKARKLLKDGLVPAVVYGKKEESTPISVAQGDFEKVLKEAGESTIVSLTGVGDDKDVLIHDIDSDPVSGAIRHVDFYAVEKDKKVQVDVQLVFKGIPPAEKELGGTLVKVMHELEIEALPRDLPNEIVVDVTSLTDFEARITAGQIALPSGVDLVTSAEETIALVAEVKEEEDTPVEADLSEIEVEEKGKKEAEGESSDEKKE